MPGGGLTLLQFLERFPDEAACREHLMAVRLRVTPGCPKCGRPAILHYAKTVNAFICLACERRLSAQYRTAFDGRNLRLHEWYIAVYLAAVSKRPPSIGELRRLFGIGQVVAPRVWQILTSLMGEKSERLDKTEEEFDRLMRAAVAHGPPD